MKTWKRAEQRAAKAFGTKRTPLSGSNGGVTASDSLSKDCYLEVKYRKHHAWVTEFHAVEEAAKKEAATAGPGKGHKFPVLILAEKGRHRLFAVVPLESGYLGVLQNQLRAHELTTEVPKKDDAASSVVYEDFTDDV